MTVELRPPRRGDVTGIVSAVNAFARLAGGDRETEAEVAAWLETPSLDVEDDARVALVAGRIVGYGDVENAGREGTQFRADVRADPTHPDAHGALLGFVEKRAGVLARPGAKLRVWAPERAAAWRTLLEQRGYAVQRYSLRMTVELDEDPPAPEWPDGIAVRVFERERDTEKVYEAHQDAFSGEEGFVRDPFADWQHWAFRAPFDPELWFLACAGDEIAGISLCYPEPREGDRDRGWVWILGVRPPWRRGGIATALLRHAFRELRARGKTRAGLGVNSNNPTALRLYERAGMRLERQYIWYERQVK